MGAETSVTSTEAPAPVREPRQPTRRTTAQRNASIRSLYRARASRKLSRV